MEGLRTDEKTVTRVVTLLSYEKALDTGPLFNYSLE
jgi:hypothetical protein